MARGATASERGVVVVDLPQLLMSLRQARGMSQTRLAEVLCDLSGRPTVTRTEISRYERGVRTPSPFWRHWLAVALEVPVSQLDQATATDSTEVLNSPWTPEGTLTSIAATAQGDLMDRRRFLISAGSDLANVADNWAEAIDDERPVAASGGRTLTEPLIMSLEARLDHLRHLDDVLGGTELYPLASAEFTLMSRLADSADIDSRLGRRLLSALAEAARICGWLNFDAGRHGSAQSFYVTALRASATAGDRATGAHVLARMADQVMTVGNPHDAAALMRVARDKAARNTTPRVRAMLHIYSGAAFSKTGQRDTAAREFDQARTAMAAGTSDDDPPWIYWMTDAEVEMLAGSAAHNLGDYRGAIERYTAAWQVYDRSAFVRDTALFLAREARAHLALGDVEAACATATHALQVGGDIGSVRPSDTLVDFRGELTDHRDVAAARDFLELSAIA